MASMQAQLSDARRQIQSLTAILTQSAHTIQTALQVRTLNKGHHQKCPLLKCVANLEACLWDGTKCPVKTGVLYRSFSLYSYVSAVCLYRASSSIPLSSFLPSTQGSSSEAEHLAKRQGLLSTLLHLLTSSPLTRSTPSHITPYTPGDLGIVPPSGKRSDYQIHQNSIQTGKGAL